LPPPPVESLTTFGSGRIVIKRSCDLNLIELKPSRHQNSENLVNEHHQLQDGVGSRESFTLHGAAQILMNLLQDRRSSVVSKRWRLESRQLSPSRKKVCQQQQNEYTTPKLSAAHPALLTSQQGTEPVQNCDCDLHQQIAVPQLVSS
jgi:hypothetical protein